MTHVALLATLVFRRGPWSLAATAVRQAASIGRRRAAAMGRREHRRRRPGADRTDRGGLSDAAIPVDHARRVARARERAGAGIGWPLPCSR